MPDVLVKFDTNWADEMDLQGFVVMTEAEWKAYKKVITHIFKTREFEVGVGTNQSVNFADADDYFNSVEVKKLSADESTVLRKHFKSSISYWDVLKKAEVKLEVALNGTFPFECPTEWDFNDDSDEDEENDPE